MLYEQTHMEAVALEKSYCLCNTSVLSDEINSTNKVSFCQIVDRR